MKGLFFLMSLFFSTLFSQPVESVMILGGGIGGLTSSLYLAQAGKNPLVVEKKSLGSVICESYDVRNWPGEKKITGNDLMQKIKDQILENGVRVIQEEVVSADFSKMPFVIETQDIEGKKTKYLTQSCVIATGSSPRFLNIPGEKEFLGKGVSTCSLCDGPLYKNKEVVVVGGGDHALLEAEYLSTLAKKITIIIRDNHFKTNEVKRLERLLEKKNVQVIYETQVLSIEKAKDNELTINLLGPLGQTKKIKGNGLFLAVGSVPNSQLFKNLDKTLDGHIFVKEGQITSKEGVYAVGDVTFSSYKQAICAASDGAKAAIQVLNYLNEHPKEAPFKKPESNQPINTLEQFNQAFLENESSPVLVEFYAPWCGACRDIFPLISKKALELEGKVKILQVNVEQIPELAQKYQIHSLPTLIVFNSKKEPVKRLLGTKDIAIELQEFTKNPSK